MTSFGNDKINIMQVASGTLSYEGNDTIIKILDAGCKQYIVVIYSDVGYRDNYEGLDAKFIGYLLNSKSGLYANLVLCTGSGNLTMKYKNTFIYEYFIFGIS